MNYSNYVNVFQGCGEIDLPKPEGIAAKWFFLKAGCGNTSPAATIPFGAMSVAPFSGGYPTGYGNHLVNTHSRPAKFEDGKKLLGFAHLQQSGTGTIGYYYNYAVVTPRYVDSPERRLPENENAEPGYYTCFLEDIKCELTSTKHVAVHKYTFKKDGGTVCVNFSNNGLLLPGSEQKKVYGLKVNKYDDFTATAEAVIEGINIYFAVKGNVPCRTTDTHAFFDLNENRTAELFVSISLRSCNAALSFFNEAREFSQVRKDALQKWENELSKIKISATEEIKEIFYSNFYHSLVKPADWSGESYIYSGDGYFVTDLATLWDMYKTAIPLIFMINREMGEKIVETLLSVGEELKEIPNALGLSEEYKSHSSQARMLGDYVLLTAYRYGVKIDVNRMLKVIEYDVFAENKKDFTVDGKCGSHTWLLDMADGCALAAEVAKETGNTELYEKLTPLAEKWKTVYSKETGLLTEGSSYYEGTLYNYSFRQMVKMDERVEIAGGKQKFAELLDDFFGYGKPDTVQPTDPFNYEPVAEGVKLKRFEGFNNESDTETPFSYVYADRHDRVCEVIRAGLKYMFTTGRGGIPGNNDTGALSSYYVLNALGLFSVAGQDLFIIGSPVVDEAEISLFNGNVLKIKVAGNSDENIYVDEVKFNSVPIDSFRIKASELLKGGTLEFTMKK